VRGKYISIINLFLIIGQIFGMCLSIQYLNHDFQSGNWRAIIALIVIPTILSLFIQVFLMKESARYELLLGN
jgi:MFS family permease